jgi:hypothetical protein
MEGEVIEVKVKNPSIEDVNRHLLNKLDELIESTDAKTNPELVKVITESVAKLNASLKGNDIFTPQETAEEKKARESKEAIQRAMKGE